MAERQAFTLGKSYTEPDFHKIATDILFSKYTPPGVIVNEQKEIVHFHGDTSAFLQQPPGKPNYSVLKMIRDDLDFELRYALSEAKETNKPVIKENIPIKDSDFTIKIEVVPLSNVGHYLILFHKNTIIPSVERTVEKRNKTDLERIKLLEEELEQMRDYIMRVSEDQESANEELLTNSEELQTLYEKLETSAEELQSNNEELITVNDELLERQEQLTLAVMYSEAIVETIREPLLVLDSELRMKSANASFYKCFTTTEQKIEGKLIFDLGWIKDDIDKLRKELNNVKTEKGKLEDFEIRAFLPKFGERIFLISVRHIVNESSAEHLLLFAMTDITDIKVAELLHQQKSLLEDNNKELSSFNFIASHDLQEPLRKIHTFSKMIVDTESEGLTDNAKIYLDRIMVSSKRMQQLINDLLSYSRINNVEDINLEYLDINLIIDEITHEMKEAIESKNANVTVAKIPLIKVLPPLITQVFTNILSNALKYSLPGRPVVIKVDKEIVPGKDLLFFESNPNILYCKISISDNGIGFLPEHSSRIFEPFQRLHAKDKYEGTGIGLAICKKIMLKHKGYITADSTLGSGSVFNLYLPL
jgi:two-component system CheB/CheR fusion protein